jgi:hypothetical protein
VHDTSDFTRALRSTTGGSAAVTVVREKKEQNLNLTLPDKNSGNLLEESFDLPEVSAEARIELSRAGEEIARLRPALEKLQRNKPCYNKLHQQLQDSQKKIQQQTEKIRHETSGEWTEI